MASRQKYRKVNLGPSEKITARTSVVGMLCVADYNDPVTNQHTLLLERVSKVDLLPGSESSKGLTARQRKKKAANGEDQSASKSLAFPGESVSSA